MSDQVCEGKICVPVEFGTTHGGKTYAKFQFQLIKVGKIINCTIWNHVLPIELRNHIINLKIDDHLILKGFWANKDKQTDAFQPQVTADSELIVKWYRYADKPVVTSIDLKERLRKDHGGEARFREYIKRVKEDRAKIGQVFAKITDVLYGWQPKEICVEVDGKWYHRIQFLIENLGAATLNEELSEFRINLRSLSSFPTSKYNEKIEELIQHAKYFCST